MAAGCSNRLVPNGNSNATYGLHTGILTAERAPVYNDSNCSCAQVGTAFANANIRVPIVPLCVHNLHHLEHTMQTMSSSGDHYPLSWASSGTEATAINVDEGCRNRNYAHNNNANNAYLQMVPANGLNEAQNHLLASQAQDMLRLPVSIQRMICERELELYSVFDDYQEYECSDLLPVSIGTTDAGFIAVGPPHIIPHSDSVRVTRGCPSTRGESSIISVPASGNGSGSGSGHWSKSEQFFDHMGAQYAGYEFDGAEEA